MSSDRNSPPLPSPAATDRRRSSVTGQTFQDLFNRSGSLNGQQPPGYPGPITTAAVNAQRRRLSLTTIGLSGSPNQNAPFPNARPRTESLSSANSGSVDESPFEEDAAHSAGSNPTTPFGRRLSFGARAMQANVRASSGNIGNPNGRSTSVKVSSPPVLMNRGSLLLPHLAPCSSPCCLSVARHSSIDSGSKSGSSTTAYRASSPVFPCSFIFRFAHRPSSPQEHRELTFSFSCPGEGYNFAEAVRSRAERSSISGAHPLHSPTATHHQQPSLQKQDRQRAKSVTVMEPPAREIPKAKVPDAFQERILKGDFYMD